MHDPEMTSQSRSIDPSFRVDTSIMREGSGSRYENEKSSTRIAEEKVGPDRWISRTIRIGKELEHPNVKKKAA